MRRALLALVLLLGLPIFAAPAAAQQATFGIRQAGEAVVDTPVTLVVEGTTSAVDSTIDPYGVRATVKGPERAQVCAPTYDADDGSPVGWWDVATGPFSLSFQLSLYPAGRKLVCAWVTYFAGSLVGPASTFVDARPPRHTLTVRTPRRARRNRRIRVRFGGSVEVDRIVLARIARGKKRCPPSDADNRSLLRLTGIDGVPTGRIRLAARTTRLKRGAYTICAYVQKLITDRRAETVTRHVFRVR